MPHYNDASPVDAMLPDDSWKPAYWTPMLSEKSLGDDICDFIETYITPPRVLDGAEEFRVREWQRWLLRHAFELNDEGFLRYRKIIVFLPRKNGKSFIASAIQLYFLFKARGGEQLYAAARDRKQARIVYDEAIKQIRKNPVLDKVIKTGLYKSVNKYKDASFEPLSGDAGSAHGLAPYGSIADELHRWDSLTGTSNRGRDMYDALTTGSKDRDEWFFFGITTGGDNDTGLAHELMDYGKKIATGEIEDDSFGFFCWQAEDDDDIYSEDTWRKANPNLAEGLLNISEFHKDLKEAEASSTAAFEMYSLNKFVRGGDKADFISGYYWKEALKPELGKIPKGADITVGFDGSLTEDSTGIVAIDFKTGLIEVLYGWEKNPLDQDWFVDVNEVEAAMDKVFQEYNVLKLYADPSRHQTTVQKWVRTYGKGIVRDIPPSASRMAPMSQEFKSDVYTGLLFHSGEIRLSTHVRNAVETIKGVPNKDKANSPRKIDFLACAILANGGRKEVESRQGRKDSGIRSF